MNHPRLPAALALVLTLVALSAFADDAAIFAEYPGTYAIYRDTRFGDESYLGICYAGEDTLLIRSFEPKTGNELLLAVPFALRDGSPEPGESPRVLKGEMASSQAASRVLPTIMNWTREWYANREAIDSNVSYAVNTDDDYRYAYWIPVLRLEGIGNDGRLELVTAGFVRDDQDARFFAFEGLPEPKDAESFAIAKKDPMEVEIDGLRIPLDGNWVSEDGRVYRIAEKTPQDAVFMVETVNLREQGINDARQLMELMMVANQNTVFLAEGSRVFMTGDQHNFFKRIYDPATGSVSIQQTQVIERDENYTSIASLACFETIYRQNAAFFDGVIY